MHKGLNDSLVVYDNEKLVATGRIVERNGETVIDGVTERGEELGDFAVRLLIRRAFEQGKNEVTVYAQTNAVPFYQKLGFIQQEFLDDNTVKMCRQGDITGNC